MTVLYTYADDDGAKAASIAVDADAIRTSLAAIGVSYERWPLQPGIVYGTPPEEILRTYEPMIEALKRQGGYTCADVISLNSDHPDRVALREKFLNEHIHTEDEVRFFVLGRGAFYLHADDKVLVVICEQGDLLRVPKDMRHWFDMGPEPLLVAIRIFTNPEGWVARFTPSDIAGRFPRLEAQGTRLA